MKFLRRAVLLAAIAGRAILFAGEPVDPLPPPPPLPPPGATPPAPIYDLKPNVNDADIEKHKPLDEILVLVNSIPIYSHTLNDIITAHVKAAQKPPDAIGMRNARRQEIQNLVHIELIRQFIKANGIQADQKKFEQYIDFLNKEATTRYGEPLQAVLRRNGTDYAQWYKVQKYVFMLRDFAASQLTDATLEEYIRQHQDSLPLRRVRHILVAYDKSVKYAVTTRTREQALARCQELLKQLKNGAAFSELAMAEGDAPEALDGGMLPFLARKTKDPALELAKPFIDAAYALQNVGDYTPEPVETAYGFHLIQLSDLRRDTPNPVHPMNNLRKFIMNTPEHYNQLVEVKWQQMIDTVHNRSTIQYFGEFEDLNQKAATPPAPDAPAHNPVVPPANPGAPDAPANVVPARP